MPQIPGMPEFCDKHIRSGPKEGQPCGKRCMIGAPTCYGPGGKLPRVRRAANVRVARSRAENAALQRLREKSGQSNQDIITEMHRLAAEVIVFKDVCRERIDELLAKNEIRYESKAGEQLRAEVALYERALDRCDKVLSSCVRLGIAERKQKLDEAHALLLMMVIRGVLDKLELTPKQKRLAAIVVPQELKAISAEAQESAAA